MTRFSFLFVLLLSQTMAWGQGTSLKLPPASPHASVGLQLGLTDITVRYSSPALSGRDVFADANVVPRGEQPGPWRAGADEATTLTTSTDITVGGQPLAAGSYSLFVIVGEGSGPWTLVVNRQAEQWGSYFYDKANDALRVPLTLTEGPKAERLSYALVPTAPNAAELRLHWGTRQASVSLGVDLNATVVADLRRQLKGAEAFNSLAWNAAAEWCLAQNTNLDEALTWAERAIQPPLSPASPTATTLGTKAAILAKLNRKAEADAVDQQALELSTAQELLNRTAVAYRGGDKARAKATLDYALKKYPTAWETANAQGFWHRMEGNLEQAVASYKKASELCPDAQIKASLQARVKSLEEQLKAKK